MGATPRGEVASRLAVETIANHFQTTQDEQELTWPTRWIRGHRFQTNRLVSAIKLANLKSTRRRNATATATAWEPRWFPSCLPAAPLLIGHVGDSRRVPSARRKLEQMTQATPCSTDYIKMSVSPRPRPRIFSTKTFIVRAPGHETLGRGGRDCGIQPRLGDLYLLCTDGLSAWCPTPSSLKLQPA